MNTKMLALLVLIIALVAGAWYLLASPERAGGHYGPGTLTSTALPAATITYTDHGFSPSSATIKAGETVKWVNESSEDLWVASAPHPLHDGYDGTTQSEHCAKGYQGPLPFDSCVPIAPGGSWAFAFTKVGAWSYHNHANDAMTGTIVVLAASSSPAATSTRSAAR